MKCACGGNYKSIDIVKDSGQRNQGHVVWATVRIKPGIASKQCDSCGKRKEQRLRQAKGEAIA